MSKKTILMLPSWYPTDANPFAGNFFREQAIAMTSEFDFVVLRYYTRKILAFKYYVRKLFCLNRPKLSFVKEDNGLKEYEVLTFAPRYIFWDLFINRFNIVVRHKQLPNGAGKFEYSQNVKARLNSIKKIKASGKLPDFDIVYTLTSQDIAVVGHDFAAVYGVPHVTAEHAPFPLTGSLLSDTAAVALESADSFLAISNDKIRQVYMQNLKVKPIWVGNYCDETKFTLEKNNNDIPVFVIVAANSFYKNLPLFVKSMEELKKIATKEFRIVIAGFNSDKGYAKNVEEFVQMVKSSSINDITTLIDSVDREDMPGLYHSCDVFVMTSIQEGLPVSALEASMCGLPVISTRCGGVEDYVDDDMGRLVSITDYKGIAKYCNDYLNGDLVFDRQLIRKKAVDLFGNEAFVNRMKNVFDSVIVH